MNIKYLFSILILITLIIGAVSVSGCTDKTDDIDTDSDELSNDNGSRTVVHGEHGEAFSTPKGIVVKDWKIVVDKVVITVENIHYEAIFVNRIATDISFDDDLSTSKHYEASIGTDIGKGETISISIHIHQFSDWEKPHLVSVEVL